MNELKTKVWQIENSKPALEALLKRVLELESNLSERKKEGIVERLLKAFANLALVNLQKTTMSGINPLRSKTEKIESLGLEMVASPTEVLLNING